MQRSPFVSCVMPTYQRPMFALQAVRYFLRQDYPERELLILDDGAEGIAAYLPRDPRIRYVRVPRLPVGSKRNIGCSLAGGDIIAQWDDDDWYAPGRLTAQVRPLLEGRADITGLTGTRMFDIRNSQAWICTPRLHRRMYRHDVHGGTLVYLRACWDKYAHYPDRSLAEDAGFLTRAMRAGARLVRLDGAELFVYIRHGMNTWSFRCGRFLDPGGWQSVAGSPIPPDERAFYTAIARSLAEERAARDEKRPFRRAIRRVRAVLAA